MDAFILFLIGAALIVLAAAGYAHNVSVFILAYVGVGIAILGIASYVEWRKRERMWKRLEKRLRDAGLE